MVQTKDNKEAMACIVQEMENVLKGSDYDSYFGDFLRDYQRVVSDSEIYVVLAGEYSTGKSSIIRAMTGDESVEIDADVKTNNAQIYDYSGFKIIDTPGLLTSNDEHTRRAERAIESADVVIYCISANQGFSPKSLQEYIKLLRHFGADRVYLAINKIDMLNYGDQNPLDVQYRIIDDIMDMLKKENVQDFDDSNVFFISAKRYLDGVEKADERRIEVSNFAYFVSAVDDTPSLQDKCSKQCRMLFDFITKILEMKRSSYSEDDCRTQREEKNKQLKSLEHIETNVIRFTTRRFEECKSELSLYFFDRETGLEQIQAKMNLTVSNAQNNVSDYLESMLEKNGFQGSGLESVSFQAQSPERPSAQKRKGFRLFNGNKGKKVADATAKAVDGINNAAKPVQTGTKGFWIFKKPVYSTAGGKGTALNSFMTKVFKDKGDDMAQYIGKHIGSIQKITESNAFKFGSAGLGFAVDIGQTVIENRREQKSEMAKREFLREIDAAINECCEQIQSKVKNVIHEAAKELETEYGFLSQDAFEQQLIKLRKSIMNISSSSLYKENVLEGV